MLLEAYARRASLPSALRDEVRQLVGWTVATEEVLRGGERVRDEWAVVGQTTTEDDRLRSQRTWLRGLETKRDALVLAFAPAGQVLDPGVAFGTAADASLTFYPGAAPLRAIVAERHGSARPLERLPGYESVDEALAARARSLAQNPWLDRFPVGLRDAVPAREPALADRQGAALALAARFDRRPLVALSGGRPVDVFGELDGDELTPLAAAAEGRVVPLA